MAYKFLTGCNYPDGKGGETRVEAGQVVDMLPADVLDSILEQECVEKIDAPTKKGTR